MVSMHSEKPMYNIIIYMYIAAAKARLQKGSAWVPYMGKKFWNHDGSQMFPGYIPDAFRVDPGCS